MEIIFIFVRIFGWKAILFQQDTKAFIGCVWRRILPISRMHLFEGWMFRKNLNDWEVEIFSSLLSKLDRVNIDVNSNDRRILIADSFGFFFLYVSF